MISQVDEALRSIVRAEALEGADVEVVFDAPTKEWAARRNAPAINLYLYDIREDLRRRETGWTEKLDGSNVISRGRIPRFFKLSYLVTAWTQRPEDEHRLLAALLGCFVRYDAMPAEHVTGALGASGLSVPITVALPPPEDRAFADVWTALGGELKPSIDVVVSAPLEPGVPQPAGPPVTEGTYLDLRDLVDGGVDVRRHRHVPIVTQQSDGNGAARVATHADSGAATVRGRAAKLQVGKDRKPRTRRRDSG